MIIVQKDCKSLQLCLLSLCVSAACFILVDGKGDENFGDKNQALKSDIATYLQSLERFEISNSSFKDLTSSIKNLFKYVNFKRQDELASLLFSYAKLRPDLFPQVQERKVSYKAFSNSKTNVIIRRNDNVLFLIFTSRPGVDWMRKKIKIVVEQKKKKVDHGEIHGVGEETEEERAERKRIEEAAREAALKAAAEEAAKNKQKRGGKKKEKDDIKERGVHEKKVRDRKPKLEPGMYFKGVEERLEHLVVLQLEWPKTEDAMSNCTLLAEYRWDKIFDKAHSAILTEQLELHT